MGRLAWLVACRVVQGTGAAVFPLAFGIIRDEFPAERVGVAIGVMSSVFGVGGGLGLVGSGFIIENLSWQWLFVIGGAPVLGAAVLIWLCVPESPVRRGGRPDFVGAGVCRSGSSRCCSRSRRASRGAGSRLGSSLCGSSRLAPSLAGCGSSAASPSLWWTSRRSPGPGMAWTNAATVLVGFSLTSFFVLAPAFVQVDSYGFGASVTQAGLYFLPSAIAMIVCGPAAGWLGTRFGHAVALRIGLAASSVAFGLLAFAHSSSGLALVWMGLLGVGIAFALAAIGTLVIENSAASETGVASGVNMIMRTIGAAVGAQIAAAVISAHTPVGALVPDESGFTIAFALAAGAAGLALIPAFAVGRRRRPRLRPAFSPA